VPAAGTGLQAKEQTENPLAPSAMMQWPTFLGSGVVPAATAGCWQSLSVEQNWRQMCVAVAVSPTEVVPLLHALVPVAPLTLSINTLPSATHSGPTSPTTHFWPLPHPV